MCALTAPDWDVLALGLHDDGGHGAGDGNGVEVGGVGRQRQDGCLAGGGPLPLHPHPVEPPQKPHGPHDGPQRQVQKSAPTERERGRRRVRERERVRG